MGGQMMNFGYDLGMWFQWNGWYLFLQRTNKMS